MGEANARRMDWFTTPNADWVIIMQDAAFVDQMFLTVVALGSTKELIFLVLKGFKSETLKMLNVQAISFMTLVSATQDAQRDTLALVQFAGLELQKAGWNVEWEQLKILNNVFQ